MKRIPLVVLLLAVMCLAACALTPPAGTQPPILIPPPASQPAISPKTNAYINGVPVVLDSPDLSTAVQNAGNLAKTVAPQYSPMIDLSVIGVLGALGVISKVLDHRKVQTAIQTPGTTLPQGEAPKP